MDNHRPIAIDATADGESDSARAAFLPQSLLHIPHSSPSSPPPPPIARRRRSRSQPPQSTRSTTATPSLPPPLTTPPSRNKKPSPVSPPPPTPLPPPLPPKKPKKKRTNIWNTTSRRGKKKTKTPTPLPIATPTQGHVLISPDESDDTPDVAICLSRFYKADKVELSDDRLTVGSGLGFRMVRATRGVADGAWYFEIRILRLGPTEHARLGWTTGKGELQAPVGYDANSFGYRDVDGCKLHKAAMEAYGGEGYGEGDVIGFYINLPDGAMYAPKPPQLILYKGQQYMYAADGKDDPPKVIPGSEMSFYKNGVCQCVAFTDLFGGRYYPAASMYTMPHQLNCEARFNFGPDFDFFPREFGGRPTPRPMIEVPYQGSDGRVEAPVENGFHTEKASSNSAFKSV